MPLTLRFVEPAIHAEHTEQIEDLETSDAAQDARLTELEAGAGPTGHEARIAALEAARTATSYRRYNLREYGAVGDGTTDDTAAWLACTAAADLTGGEIAPNPGRYKVTVGRVFNGGANNQSKAVYIRGAGDHNTIIEFHPSNLDDSLIQFGQVGAVNYFGGGVSDIQLFNPARTCRGAAVKVVATLHTHLHDAYLYGFAGVGGAGLRCVQDDQRNVQHLHLSNVYLQQNYYGMIGQLGGAASAFKLNITQNTYQAANFTGDLLWSGGALQQSGSQSAAVIGDMALPGAGSGTRIENVYIECSTSVVYDLRRAANVQITNGIWQGAGSPQTLVKANLCSGLLIEGFNMSAGGHKYLESLNSRGRVQSGDPTWYSIDADSCWDFIGSGGLYPSAFRVRTPPVYGGATASALVLGAGLELGKYTTAQRDALVSVQTGTLIFNTTAGVMQCWNGSSWV